MKNSDDWFQQEIVPHHPALLAWLRARYPSIDDHEDIVQEALLRVCTAHRSGRVRSPKSFLFTTARNLVIDKFRRNRQGTEIPLAESDFGDVMDDGPGVPEMIARDQELEFLTAAIQSLPTQCRRVFTLRKVYGMSQKSVAAEMGISVNTVSAQLTIGLRKCREYMQSRIKHSSALPKSKKPAHEPITEGIPNREGGQRMGHPS